MAKVEIFSWHIKGNCPERYQRLSKIINMNYQTHSIEGQLSFDIIHKVKDNLHSCQSKARILNHFLLCMNFEIVILIELLGFDILGHRWNVDKACPEILAPHSDKYWWKIRLSLIVNEFILSHTFIFVYVGQPFSFTQLFTLALSSSQQNQEFPQGIM